MVKIINGLVTEDEPYIYKEKGKWNGIVWSILKRLEQVRMDR